MDDYLIERRLSLTLQQGLGSIKVITIMQLQLLLQWYTHAFTYFMDEGGKLKWNKTPECKCIRITTYCRRVIQR